MQTGSVAVEPQRRFIDAITYELMVDPVVLSDGHTVDRTTASQLTTSPWTREAVRVVADNVDLRGDLFEAHPAQETLYRQRRTPVHTAALPAPQPERGDAAPMRLEVYRSGAYWGQFHNGLRHGTGSYRWSRTGDTYDGAWWHGSMHGHGVRVWANADRYEGTYLRGKRTGHGVFTWHDGARYEGEFVEGKRTGRGILTQTNGERLEGNFSDGVFQGPGTGTKTLPNGDRLEGTFHFGALTGRGVRVFANGDRAEGYFVRDSLSGPCTLTKANGDCYKARLDGFAPTGVGSVQFANGDCFEGSFCSGHLSMGLYTRANGERFEGTFRFLGQTTAPHFTVADDSAYAFVAKKITGQGVEALPGGCKYTGTFKDGKRSGKATQTWADGHSVTGVFNDGKCVQVVNETWPDGCTMQIAKLPASQVTWTWPNGDVFTSPNTGIVRSGPGEYRWADGSRYVGHFANNRRHGKGKFYSGRTCIEGVWQNDVFVKTWRHPLRARRAAKLTASHAMQSSRFGKF